jgi:hypothetical protein
MNAMTKAHEIRRQAAVKWNCKVSEIHFGECLRMAHNNEDIEMKKITVLEAARQGLIKREDGSALPLAWAEIGKNRDQVIPFFSGDKITGNGETYTISAVYFSDQGEAIYYRFVERPKIILSLNQLITFGATKA